MHNGINPKIKCFSVVIMSVSEHLSWNSPDLLPGCRYLFPATYQIYFFETSLITIRLQSSTVVVMVMN